MQNQPPIKEGEEYDVEIEAKGDGIAKIEKFVVIVKDQNVAVGDKVKIRIDRVVKTASFASIIGE